MADKNKKASSPAARDVEIDWHALSAADVLQKLEAPTETGLSTAEARKRLEKYGENQLQEGKRVTFLQMVIGQLNNFVIILLIVAAIISAVLGEVVDSGAIIAIVLLNTIMGVVQESRAEQALAALKKLAAPEPQGQPTFSGQTVPVRRGFPAPPP